MCSFLFRFCADRSGTSGQQQARVPGDVRAQQQQSRLARRLVGSRASSARRHTRRRAALGHGRWAHSASGQRGQRSGGAALERLLPRTRARPGGPARGRLAQQAWQAGSGSGQRWAVAAGLQQATREQPSAPCRQGRPLASAGVELLAP